MKKWYESNTIRYAIATGLAGIVAAFATAYPDVGFLAIANSVFIVILRMFTVAPITPTDSQ